MGKQILKTITTSLLAIVLIYSLIGCKQDMPAVKANEYTALSGQVIGTYYNIRYSDTSNYSKDLEVLFEELNQSLSTYVPTSTISRLNQSRKHFAFHKDDDRHFMLNWLASQNIHKLSGGSFEPTIMPLVNYWGFGYKNKGIRQTVDEDSLSLIRSWVGIDKIHIEPVGDSTIITKNYPEVQLDFSAIAKGYYVDEVGRFLANKDITNYLVDIGGEAVAVGVNAQGEIWKVGINTPKENSDPKDLEVVIQLDNIAVATSGNYRNFYINDDGNKYVHTISPSTGKSEASNLLSATILAPDCMNADALATACMVKGMPEALTFIESIPNVEALFLTDDGQGGYQQSFTGGFDKYRATK